MVRAASFSNVGLELGEGVLNGIEIGAVGRQVEQCCSACFDSLPDTGDLVGGQIVHDDQVTWPQDRGQHLLAPRPEGFTVHRPVEHHRGDEAGQRQPADEGHGLPVAVRDGGAAALAFGRPAAQACHLG